MCERARRSQRDESSRYSIDTLFPQYNNSAHTRTSGLSSPVALGLGVSSSGLETSHHPSSRSSNNNKRKPSSAVRPEENHEDIPLDISYKKNTSDKVGGGNSRERMNEESKMSTTSNELCIRNLSRGSSKSAWTANESRAGGSSSSSTSTTVTTGSKRKSSSPLKPATQPKQMFPPIVVTKMSRKGMFEVFQPWVQITYGDSAKTKTITKKKYNRIVKTLRGEEINNAENSKFRFWVKAKGFSIGPPAGHPLVKDDRTGSVLNPGPNEPDLYVPTTVKDGSGLEKPVYKRVAVVEYFFDIIYTVHVETEAKNGKHAGQKRTYRAITEKYAFLPREAVTKFLLQCTECQKRGSPGVESSSNGSSNSIGKSFAVDRSPSPENTLLEMEEGGLGTSTTTYKKSPSALDINFSLPLTTTYLRQQQQQEKKHHHQKQMREGRNGFEEDEDDDEESHLSDPTSGDDDLDVRMKEKGTSGSTRSKNGEGKDVKQETPGAMDWLGYQPLGLKKEAQTTNNNIYSNGKHEFREQSSPLSLSDRLAVNHEVIQDETSSNGNKDDEDDDDDESDDRIDTQQQDPERLKAFNMFVRLFVDENLDRMVPISKQPKEKIQAIIDSCSRQFPECSERARKRIRTYLKSCRRNKRSRDGGWESSRPTPAHLTSVQAEQILAQACENESQNAKRMRMGLEPVSQPLPMPLSESRGSKENGHHTSSSSGESSPEKPSKISSSSSHVSSNIAATIAAVASNTTNSNSLSPSSITPSSITANVSTDQNVNLSLNGATSSSSSSGESILNQLPSSFLGLGTKTSMDRTALVDYSRALNGNGAPSMSMYRPANFGQTFQRPAPFPTLFPPVTTAAAAVGALGSTFPHNVSPLPVANGDAGPTDLSMKSKPLLTQKLNATELATVRQLITGYRESAAFLLRSADELEQLLISQQ